MTTAVTIGYGTTFEVSTDGGSVYTPLAEVTNITPPSDNLDIIDATNMDSPNATREFVVGLNDPGECSLEMNFIPGSTADQKIIQIRDARVAVYCKITFPNAVVWTFLGILTGYEPAIPTDDKMTATVTFKVTGSYTVS
jgi:Lambda phage tail tube protein, TTP